MADKKILNGIITAYRKILSDRYEYQNLFTNYNLPDTIDETQVTNIKNYFLTHVYPDIEKRKQLNEAFESLDNYIKNPSKLLQLLVDSASLIFKYGRHLPKILNSGIKALRSFRDANKFEKLIIDQAIASKKQPPYSKDDIFDFIKKLPRKDIDQFIDSTKSLFQIFHDKTQIKNIIEIVAFLITKMKSKSNLYSKKEIKGLEIGYQLIKEGNSLFEKLGKENQKQLIDFIVHVETNTLDHIYNEH